LSYTGTFKNDTINNSQCQEVVLYHEFSLFLFTLTFHPLPSKGEENNKIKVFQKNKKCKNPNILNS